MRESQLLAGAPLRFHIVDDERAAHTLDLAWLEARGTHVEFRASLEHDLAAFEAFEPDVAVGTTPVVQKAKEKAVPALYFTNLISARPLMGPAGAGSLAQVINAAKDNGSRFRTMHDFFEGVGIGHATGVWQGTQERVPQDRPQFKAKFARQLAKLRKDAEAIGS